MKKRISTIRIFIIFLILYTLHFTHYTSFSAAAPVYGPKMPKRSQWFIGFETNLVFKMEMKKNLGDAKSDQYFYNASYGLYDWFSFDGKLGMGDTGFEPGDIGKLDFDSGFAGAYGARFRIYNNEEKGVRAILGFQHISAHPPKKVVGDMKYSAIWDEWQLSLLASKALGAVEPYIGAKASQLFIIRKDNVTTKWAWNGARDHFGLFAGAAIDLPKNWLVDVEGRFIDETALSVQISYKL